MNQEQIDALLKDSMFEDSQIRDSQAPKSNKISEDKQPEVEQYGDQFQSYEESRRTFSKNASKNQFQESKKAPQTRKKLQDIKEEVISPLQPLSKTQQKSVQKPRPKTGIYFYPPKKQESTKRDSNSITKNLPYNYARLQEREKQLLLTTLTQQNKQLKEDLRNKQNNYKKLESTYKTLLQQKAREAPSVKEATLQKQLKSLQQKYEKLQNLCKLERQKNQFHKTGKTIQTFVPQQRATQRQEQLLQIIDKLKQRLINANIQLKSLQNRLNQGQNYVDELKRKLKRIQQLEYKIQKMAEQAENDRQFITSLKQKNLKLQNQLNQMQKQKRLLQIQIRRYQLGQATQTDIRKQLEETKKEKEMLERNLRDLATNMGNLSKVRNNAQWTKIQDSGELLRS